MDKTAEIQGSKIPGTEVTHGGRDLLSAWSPLIHSWVTGIHRATAAWAIAPAWGSPPGILSINQNQAPAFEYVRVHGRGAGQRVECERCNMLPTIINNNPAYTHSALADAFWGYVV